MRSDSRPSLPRAAQAEGLRFSNDSGPGIRRIRCGSGFSYRYPDGRKVSDAGTLRRIRALAIPPAYRDVWICPNPQGHVQATARDARGRKQYRYHPRWRSHRDEAKFDRMLEFGRALPRIRRRVSRDLRRAGLPRERVLATIVHLLETTLVRVGNEEYARHNGSFGLTTLRDRHVGSDGGDLYLEFRGKSAVAHRVRIGDPLVARIVRKCADIPGQELFQWIDEAGRRRPIDSSDVNDYLREASGKPFTAKDFRTWFASVEALVLLRASRAHHARDAKQQSVRVVQVIAARLGNTPAICRKCYIHPEILLAHADGRLAALEQVSPPRALQKLLGRRQGSRRKQSPTMRPARGAARARIGPTVSEARPS